MVIDNHFTAPDPVWEKHRQDVERLAEMTGSCIFVLERKVCHPFLSPKLTDVLGLDVPPERWSPDWTFLHSHIHPDDLPVFLDIQDRLLYDFIVSLPREEQKDYKHIFEFRAIGKNGEVVRVISQHQILDFGAQDQPVLLGAIDLSPDQSSDAGVRFTLMNFKTGEIVPFAVRESPEGGLTKREIEILSLIDRGMYSKEISERLSISVHTVNRHRQNILEKTNADNSREAINYARKMGFLA